MNTKFLNAILILGLVMTVSCSQATVDQLEAIKKETFANDYVGQQIVDTVQLQLTTGGSVDRILRLLNGLVEDLKAQQLAHDAERAKKNAAWKAQIAGYNKVIKQLQARIADLHTQIVHTKAVIRQLKRHIKVTLEQIRLVKSKQADLVQARKVDKAAYRVRVKRQREMLKAVNFIISSLQTALKNGKYVQLSQIKEQLASMVKENPIEALVQLTMTFNPKSVSFAIEKLAVIRGALVSSLKDEKNLEAQAKAAYHSLQHEIEQFLDASNVQLAGFQDNLAKNQLKLAGLRKDIKQARGLLKINQQLRAAAVLARKVYNANYHAATKQRAAEGVIIQKVVSIVKAHQKSTQNADDNAFTVHKKKN